MHDDLELLKMFNEVDDGSDEMAEVGRELVSAICEDIRSRREPSTLELVGSRHPFMFFFSVWVVAYISLGGALEGERFLTVAMLCCACCLLDIAGHLYRIADASAKGRGNRERGTRR